MVTLKCIPTVEYQMVTLKYIPTGEYQRWLHLNAYQLVNIRDGYT